jgi:alpha-L-fucosidase
MDKFWVNETEGEPTPVHSNEKALAYIKKVIENGGVFAYNVAPWQEGRISEATMKQLRFIAENLK